MKKIFLSLIVSVLCINVLIAQNSDISPESKKRVRVVETERALKLMEMNIEDKSSDYITVNDVQYRWFPTKDKALDYFNQMNVKRDLTIFYIDSKGVALKEPELITIREKVEIKISE